MANALSYGLPQQENPLSPIPSAPTFGGAPKPQMGAANASMPQPSKKVNALSMQAPKVATNAPVGLRQNPRASVSPNALAAFMPQQQKPDAMYAFMDTLQRTIDPAAADAREQRMTTQQQQKLQQNLSYVQHMQGMPMDQRLAFAQQVAGQMGIDAAKFDANAFTDEALAQSIATLSSHLGIAPTAPEYMNLGGGNVGMVRDGKFSLAREVPQEAKPTWEEVNGRIIDVNDPTNVLADYSDQDPEQGVKWEEYQDASGQLWQINPYTGEPRKVEVPRGRVPGSDSGPQVRYENISAAEMEAMGYPPGTIGQRNVVTGQINVTSRPTTQQTGQPTEGERAAGLHAGIAINGLQNLTQMEQGQGYNRAGGWEQAGGFVGGENERLYDQAAAEFIDGYLRAMTGAAATSNEIATYRAQWFPQFGDTPKVVQQKAEGRLNAIRQMKSKTGRAWNPEWDAIIADLERQVGGGAQPGAQSGPEAIINGPAPAGLPPEMKAVWEQGNPTMRRVILGSLTPQQLQAVQQQQLPPGVTQEMWDVMDEEDRAAFR